MLTSNRLRDLAEYDANTGEMLWRVSRGRKKPGDQVGCLRHDGYVIVGIDSKLYLRHRLAWLYQTGHFPLYEIDHRNGIKGDDRFSNLRESLHSQNMANVKMPSTNSSGIKGVQWHPQTRKWRVQIGRGISDRKHIGLFDTIDEAALAYRAAACGRYGEFARVE